MRAAQLQFSNEFLGESLNLPVGTRFVDAYVEDDGTIIFLVEHPTLPEAGATIPTARALYRTVPDPQARRTEFHGWVLAKEAGGSG
jgi:hypothetical protein